MKVLFVTSEAAPIKKFGGLGDYSGSLPKALENLGVEVDIILPYYSDSKVENLKLYKALDLFVPFNNETHKVEVFKTKLPESNVNVILPKSAKAFSGNFISDTEYFAFFDSIVVHFIEAQFNTYDIVHCNDWHTGFVTHLLEDELDMERPKTLLTIHNLGYQGVSTPDLVREVGFLPGQHPLIDWDIEDGDINMLQQGITSSDYVNTVSKSYADELMTPEFAGDFVDIMQQRRSRFVGILNGIDYSMLPRDFSLLDWRKKKAEAKKRLMAELGLAFENKPIFSIISRIDIGQKGLDILLEAVPHIVKNGGQFVLLGTGDNVWENKFLELEKDPVLRNFISINIKFDVKLAERIYAASEFFLVPSKYEPCGLTQMMSMWYGALPIVHNVGGLKDTVVNGKNGFTFDTYTSEALEKSISEAFRAFEYPSKYAEMVTNALNADFSWGKSAQEYKNLYHKILEL